MSTDTIVAPEVGMQVTWIDPSLDPQNRSFIQENLIERYGKEGLRIISIRDLGEEFNIHGKERWSIILERNGRPIVYDHPRDDNTKQVIIVFTWHLHRPVS